MDTLLAIIMGIVIGFGFAWVIRSLLIRSGGNPAVLQREVSVLNESLRGSEQQAAKLEERGQQLEKQLKETKLDRKELQEELASAQTEGARVSSNNKSLQTKLDEQEGNLKNIQEQFRVEFENLANKLLEEKSKKFTALNKEKMEELLLPLGEKIVSFRQKVEETYEKESLQRQSFKEQLKQLCDLNNRMSADAKNLTSALKGESQVRGAWGEMILEQLLEHSGLMKGVHYRVQETFQEDGSQLRPDVVINLPEEKNLVVDSKVSLVAYEQYCSTEDEDETELALKNHVSAIRLHVKALSEKNYQALYELESLDFVLMFVPIEPAFLLAAQATLDPKKHGKDLFGEAFEQGVVIVSTSTLMATLKTIESIWRREDQNRHALTIAQKSGAMYDKLVGFVEDLQKIGQRLKQAGKSYDDAMNKLGTGRGNLVRRAEEIRLLGAATTKVLPDEVAAISGEEKVSRLEANVVEEGDE